MSESPDPASPQTDASPTSQAPASAQPVESSGEHRRARLVLCPYCGHTQTNDDENRCHSCKGLFEPLSRRATQISMGPWYIRDKGNPHRPGCSYPVMIKMIESGRITPTTVVRGPSTHQFWSIARNTPGLSHLLGYCHKCGKHVQLTDEKCPHCETKFKSVKQRDELGLLYPSQRRADAAQSALNKHLGLGPAEPDPKQPPPPDDSGEIDLPQADEAHLRGNDDSSSGDLLDDLFGQEISLLPAGSKKVTPLDFTPSDDADRAEPMAASPLDTPMSPAPDARHLNESQTGTAAHSAFREEPAQAAYTPPERGDAPPVEKANSLVVWLLISLNVIVIGGVVAYILYKQMNIE